MDDLDREICAALAVEPSPQFVARARTAAAERPVAPPLYRWFALAAAATVLVALAVGIAVFRAERALSVAPRVATSAISIGPNVTPLPGSASLDETRPRTQASRRARAATKRGEAFEVIVSKPQVDAHLHLFSSVGGRIGEAKEWTFDNTAPVTNHALDAISISAITIESMDRFSAEKGVIQ
jgi:hypothetical protein